ncbi:MAG: DUF2064 domain-containing protein [Eubacteriales bacterium]
MKKAVMVFTKVPKAGDVKTRLTEKRGGILTPEEANDLYIACMLDVVDACIEACTEATDSDMWICYNKDGDRAYLDTLLAKVDHPEKIVGVFPDEGGHFNECMQYATDNILKSGEKNRLADGLLIIGGDLPSIQPGIVIDALNKLDSLSESEAGKKVALKNQAGSEIGASIVEGACQEGGFSIIGFTCSTPFDFTDVFYNLTGTTALDMLLDKATEGKIPFAPVEMVPDIDIPVDLASSIPVLRGIELAAKYDSTIFIPKRTVAVLEEMGITSVALPPQR